MKNFILTIIFLGSVLSKLSIFTIKEVIDDICNEYDDFDDFKYSMINPTLGYLFEYSGSLNNLRFFGPNLIFSNPRDYSIDSSDDNITDLLIHLFPSPVGTLCHIRNKTDNFGFKFEKNKIKGIEFMADVFSKILIPDLETNYNQINRECKIFKSIRQKMLTFDKNDIFPLRYQKYIKLMSIHAFMLNSLEDKHELRLFIELILLNIHDKPYEKFNLNCEMVEEMIKIDELFSVFPYSELNQPYSNAPVPIYDRENDIFIEQSKFSDCVDILILNICNCIFYDSDKKCYFTPNLDPRSPLAKFYSKHRKIFTITNEIRKEWSKVIQGLEDFPPIEINNGIQNSNVTYGTFCGSIDRNKLNHLSLYKLNKISYINEKRNELNSGIINMMNVIIKICNINHAAFWEDFNGLNVLGKLRDLFYIISPNKYLSFVKVQNEFTKFQFEDRLDFIGEFHLLFKKENELEAKISVSHSEKHSYMHLLNYNMKSSFDKNVFPSMNEFESDYLCLPLKIFKNFLQNIKNLIGNNGNNFDKIENTADFIDRTYFSGIIDTNKQKHRFLVDITNAMLSYKPMNVFDPLPDLFKNLVKIIFTTVVVEDYDTIRLFSPFQFFNSNLIPEQIFEGWTFSLELQDTEVFRLWENRILSLEAVSIDIDLARIQPNRVLKLFDILSQMPSLIKLRVIGIKEANRKEVLEGLGRMNKITSLILTDYFMNNEFADRLGKTLGKLTQLTSLILSSCSFDEIGVVQVARSIGNLVNLKSLDISGINLKILEMKEFINSIRNLKDLNELNLSNSNLASEGFHLLVPVLSNMKRLRVLNLSNNNLFLNGHGDLINLIEKLKKLKSLNIRNTNLTADAVKYVARALSTLEKLEDLNFSYDFYLAQIHAEYLARALKEMKNLKKINFSAKNIFFDQFKKIISALLESRGLERLKISEIIIEPKHEEQIQEFYEKFKHLKKIEIFYVISSNLVQ